MMFWTSAILIVSFVAQGQCQYGSSCTTTDDVQGICVPVKSCKPAFDFFNQIRERGGAISASEREEIQSLHCGTFGSVPHVCCEDSKVQLNPDGFSVLQSQPCGIYNTNKVTHGFAAILSGYPWMALLMYDDERDPFKCAGSLISQQHVLTAAHCIRGKESTLKSVRFGEHQKSTITDCVTLGGKEICAPPTEDVGIAELIIHPDYRTVYNDIGLIRLDRKVELKSHIKPLCLPIYDNLRSKVHDQYVISGWGRTETGNSADVLQVALVPRVETATCESQLRPYKFRYDLNESHLCAGGRDLVDTCKGDSGGPLGFRDMYDGRPRFIQYGIVASGLTNCGADNVPGIYTNVSYYIQWITDNIKLE